MPGVPNKYYEASFRSHVVSPGNYTITLKVGDNILNTNALILDNPHYNVSKEDYDFYDKFMLEMEHSQTEMFQKINQLKGVQDQLRTLMFISLKISGRSGAWTMRSSSQ